MFGSEILDVAIGLMFVYLLMSLVCSALREMAEAWFKARATFLHVGLRELLKDEDGTDLVRALHEHPSVYALYRGKYAPTSLPSGLGWLSRLKRTNLPAYIPASNFAVALLDIAARGREMDDAASATRFAPQISIADIRAQIGKLGNPQVQRAILSAIDMAGGDLAAAQANIEAWYNGAMDRVSGWYKRRTQMWLFVLGASLSVWFNVNTITIARYLYRDESARAALVANAQRAVADTSLRTAPLDTLLGRLDKLDLPIGWRYGVEGVRRDQSAMDAVGSTTAIGPRWASRWITASLGWLITALAVSLGAPFWFDLLNKVMVIRSTVKPHEKSREEASEDRQLPKARRSAGARGGTTAATTQSATPAQTQASVSHEELEAELPDEPDLPA
jgi:hypothetical protein